MSLQLPFDRILSVATRKDLAETGGGHNQKGVDFQRHWAVMRMVELEKEGVGDYLFLFEAIQDIAELDSSDEPRTIKVYQVKKKDRNEWSWAELTGLPTPRQEGGPTISAMHVEKLQGSPLGKLAATIVALGVTTAEGFFVSNAGCDLPLGRGGNAATSLPCKLCDLTEIHQSLLHEGFGIVQANGLELPDLAKLHLQRVPLPVDAPKPFLVGFVHDFLRGRSPRHAGQAQSLVEALLLKIGPLGAQTDSFGSFEELRRERGYARADFANALNDLESTPDAVEMLDDWFAQLRSEGMPLTELSATRMAVSRVYRQQLHGLLGDREAGLNKACDAWLDANEIEPELLARFESCYSAVSNAHPWAKKSDVYAHLALRAIDRCVDQI